MENLKFDEKGLIPAIIQDYKTGEVLMLAYMNRESFKKTIETNRTWFYSRSRQQLWCKGETSGNIQIVKEIKYDCDADALLVLVEQVGPACHTGNRSCFFRNAKENPEGSSTHWLFKLEEVIKQRKIDRPKDSYTAKLFERGIEHILKKVMEEAEEMVDAAKNESQQRLIEETADLLFHLLVLLQEKEIDFYEVENELMKRHRNKTLKED